MTDIATKKAFRVLLIEDDPEDKDILKRLLEHEGTLLAEFDWASNGDEGLALASRNEYDIILLDYYLGKETAREFVKRMPMRLDKIAIMVLTGKNESDADEESLGMGAESFLSKDNLTSSLLWRSIRFAIRNKELQNRLSDFASILAHDLNGPAANITGILNLIEMELESGETEEVPELVERAKTESQRISRLVNGLHEFCESKDGALNIERAHLSELVDEAAQSLEISARTMQASITKGELHECYCDSNLFIHIFKNLIQNSIKYNDSEVPRIHIESQETPSKWRITVKDNGIGLEAKHLDRIFRPMERVDSEKTSGSGLGLAICKEVVERHGGNIWAESEGLGHGIAFHITLPRDLETYLINKPQ